MDPASVIGVVAAAMQFAEAAWKLIKLVRDIHAGTEDGPTNDRLVRLETWAEVALKIKKSSAPDDPLTEKILKQCTRTVETLAGHLVRSKVSKGDGIKERTRKAMVARLKRDDVTELFAQLHRDQTTLHLYHDIGQQGNLLQKIRDTMGDLLDDRLQYSNQKDQSTVENKFLGAIFVTDPRDDRSALISRKTARADGTCTWITKTTEFCEWMSTTAKSPGLVVEGGPGKGKSMIAIYLTQYLEQLAQTQEADTDSVIYFFCDDRNKNQNNALAIIRCLVWQLCRLRPQLLHHGIAEVNVRGDAKQLLEPPNTAIETLWRIFLNMLKDDAAGTVTCVIDGLDECDEDSISTVLAKFYGFAARENGSKFRFIILSRPISSWCQPQWSLAATVPRIQLDPDLNHSDILVFIKQQVDELAQANPMKPWRPSLREHVEKTLLKKADGTFLWVGFVVDDLRGRPSFDVKRVLDAFPPGLYQVYDRMLRDVPLVHRAKIRSILHWICLAEHPLNMSELAGLIYGEDPASDDNNDSDTDSSSLHESVWASELETLLEELDGLIEYCRPMIKISDHRRVRTNPPPVAVPAEDDLEKRLHLVHQSAKDYFMQTRNIADPSLEYFLVGDPQIAHENLGLRCMEILEHGAIQRMSQKDEWAGYHDRPRNRRYECRDDTSLDYAASLWMYHVRLSGGEYHNPATLGRVMSIIGEGGSLRKVWFDYINDPCLYHGPFRKFKALKGSSGLAVDGQEMDGLRIAIWLGLSATVHELIPAMRMEDYQSALKSPKDGSLLKLAIRKGHMPVVELLLHHFGTNIVSLEPGSLQTAVRYSMDQAVKLLLALKPSPRDVHGDGLEEALIEAVSRRDLYHTTELLKAGADPHVLTEDGHSLLMVLAKANRYIPHGTGQNLPQSLLAWGVDHSLAHQWYGYTALHLAVDMMNLDTATVLVEGGAHMDAVDFGGRTPLHRVVKNPFRVGRDEKAAFITLAASKGRAWIDHQDSEGRSALHYILKNVEIDVVVLDVLIELGSNPNLKDHKGRTPLALWVADMASELVEFMEPWLDPPNDWSLPAWGDLMDDFSVVIDILGRGGANGNEQDNEGRTVLHILAQMMGQVPVGMPCLGFCIGLHFLGVLRRVGVDEGLRDINGKTAREYYPVEYFWTWKPPSEPAV